jgi:hypothetical protein
MVLFDIKNQSACSVQFANIADLSLFITDVLISIIRISTSDRETADKDRNHGT